MCVCDAGFLCSSSAPCFLLRPSSKTLQSSPFGFEQPTHPKPLSRVTQAVTWHFMHIVDLYWSLVIRVCASCSGLRVIILLGVGFFFLFTCQGALQRAEGEAHPRTSIHSLTTRPAEAVRSQCKTEMAGLRLAKMCQVLGDLVATAGF